MPAHMRAFREAVAVVTGGASGIGQALCKELGQRGATVVVADRNGSGAAEVAAAIAAAGGQAQAHAVDVTSWEAVEALVAGVVEQHGRLDYLFNNAGIGVLAEERDATLADWHKVLAVNLWGVIHGVRAAYPRMLRQGFGHIINTASLAGLTPAPMEVSYTASKHAVVGLSCALRVEAADLGVRVSVVCPGLIDTPILHTTEMRAVDGEGVRALIASGKPMAPAACAGVILRGVEKNKAIIVVGPLGRFGWWLTRLSPGLAMWFWRTQFLRRLRALRH
ncbi:MAG: SDR family oxidoreductase [Deltaproteobacteria bacterium]|nr:SDR family oxidoreductase [Deltaproteobacteria bacterium]